MVPELKDLSCPSNITLSTAFYNSMADKSVAMEEVINIQSACDGCPPESAEFEAASCAIIGMTYSSVTEPVAIVTSVVGIPQISAQSTSTALSDSVFTSFARTVPSDASTAFAAARYFLSIGMNYVCVLNMEDTYGSSFANEFTIAMEKLGGNVISLSYSTAILRDGRPNAIERSGVGVGLRAIKQSEFSGVLGVFTEDDWLTIMRAAREAGVVGSDYFWCFTDSMTPQYFRALGKTDEEDYSLAYGSAIVLAGGAIEDLATYQNFVLAWNNQPGGAANFTATVNSMLPDGIERKNVTYMATNRPSSQVLFYYDAVMSVGLAACSEKKWSSFNLNDRSNDDDVPILYKNILKQSFIGASGRVKFNNDTHDRKFFTVPFEVQNVYATPPLVDTRSKKIAFKLDFSWLSVDLSSYSKQELVDKSKGEIEFIDVVPFEYYDGSTSPPAQRYPPPEDYDYIGKSIRVASWIICILLILGCFLCLLWVYLNREERIVRASQPEFLSLLAFGVMVFSLTLFFLTVDDEWVNLSDGESTYCMLTIWFAAYGFCLIFSALFSKIWRINKIFKNAAFRKVRVTRNDVLIPFIVLVCVVTALLVFMQIYGPYRWERTPQVTDSFGNVLMSRGKCTGNDQTIIFVMCIIGVNAVVLLLALYQAYQARAITVEYSESTYIGYAMVSMFQVFLIGTPLLFLLNENQTTFVYGCLAIVSGTSVTVLGFMFVPKVRLLYEERHPEKFADKSGTSSLKTSSTSSKFTGRAKGKSQKTVTSSTSTYDASYASEGGEVSMNANPPSTTTSMSDVDTNAPAVSFKKRPTNVNDPPSVSFETKKKKNKKRPPTTLRSVPSREALGTKISKKEVDSEASFMKKYGGGGGKSPSPTRSTSP